MRIQQMRNSSGILHSSMFIEIRCKLYTQEFRLISALSQPYKLKDIYPRHRIAISPMCQYTAGDGLLNVWHRVHQAGLVRIGSVL